PPMPMQNATSLAHRSVLVDPSCLETNPETGDTTVVTCRKCAATLKSNKVPPRAVANHNYLGPVPSELESLTRVEEALIALRRAKCWIIQLRKQDSETGIPITQRGVCSHIIVYPQRPSAIATSLPPSMCREDIVTPICVIFVGSQPPTQEWLQKKASPMM
ncbi:hypothetical protein DFH09DRAFT_1406097, partial [Mycena vulgaris]